MIGRLEYVVIAVKDLQAAATVDQETLGATVSEAVLSPSMGFRRFHHLAEYKIELLEPLGANSPIAKFLERNAEGATHHICTRWTTSRPHATGWWIRARAFSATGSPKSARTASLSFSCTRRIFADARRTRTEVTGHEHPLAIARYAICWWIVLFAILPFKIGQSRRPSEATPSLRPRVLQAHRN